ncbi:MAG: PAS domain S-box protein [Candidatus Bathyarchaeia archaeon]
MKSDTDIRVLHVDDDNSFVDVAKTILSGEGPFIIETATSVEEALTKIHEGSFDVIVSDYDMPRKNGLEFFKTIRGNGFTAPFILFTGKGREEIVVQALNLGVDRYISKHGDPETVYTELSVAIKQLHENICAQKRLWESEERFKQMVTNSKDLIMLTGTDGVILYLSPSCRDILGYEPIELIGKTAQIIHPADSEQVQKIFQSALTTQLNRSFEYRIITKQGQTRWVNHSFSQIIENNKIKQIVSTVKDITEEKNTQAKLFESEERWNFALEGSGHGVWDYNAQENTLFLSKKWKQILGYEEHEIKNDVNEWKNRLHPDDKEKTIQGLEDLIAGKKPYYTKKYRLMSKDGSYRWILSQGKIVTRTPEGKVLRIVGTILDITIHEKAINALKESEEKFSAAFYSNGAALAVSRLEDGLILEVNDCFLETFGYTREEIVGKTAAELHLYADLTDRQQIVDLSLRNHRIINREVKGKKKDKSEITVLFSTKLFNIKGQKHLLTTLIDISNLKMTEKALLLSQKELENLFYLVPDAVIVGDLTGKIIDCNELSAETFGYTKNEILGFNGLNFIEESKKDEMIKEFVKSIENKQVQKATFTFVSKNKKECCVEASIKALYDNRGEPTGFIAIIRDITERTITEKKLQESEKRYRFMAENAQDLITISDITGNFIFISPSIERLTGFTPEELIGKKTVISCIHEADYPLLVLKIRESIKNNVSTQVEIRFLTKYGSYIWLEANISSVKDTNGKTRLISISRDVTQRKIDHEERNKALAKAEMLLKKLTVVDGFVRHDIRNKLAVITSTLYLSKKYANSSQHMLNQIDHIKQATDNIERILEFAQTYEAVGSQGLSWRSIDKAIEDAKILVPNITSIEINTENVDFEVLADSALVEIFHNLMDNSMKYAKNLSKIRIFNQTNQNGNAEIVYEDNGGGIDVEIKPRLFQKGAGKGTGLGLYLIQRICEIYGWQVSENGEIGKGVRFMIEIPQERIRKTIVN